MTVRLGLLLVAVVALRAQSGTEMVLHNFTVQAGGEPYGNLLADPSGNFYGTAMEGGLFGQGVLYKVNVSGTYSIIHNFGAGTDGRSPMAGVSVDAAGNLYGTTYSGGTAGGGTVFRVDSRGDETVLYSFTGGADGSGPQAGVVHDGAGNLYGTTMFGGSKGGYGVVFKVDQPGRETVLHTFTGRTDGGRPWAGVVRDAAGNLYGAAWWGGAYGQGVVYKLDPAGQFSVLHSFTGGSDGGQPIGNLVLDSEGNLYGTTNQGGPAFGGVIYKIDRAGDFTLPFSFGMGNTGYYPTAGVTLDAAGNLYGTTLWGGYAGYGVVFKVDTAGQQTVYYSFPYQPANPTGGVIFGPQGNLYGVAGGGSSGVGVVYAIKLP